MVKRFSNLIRIATNKENQKNTIKSIKPDNVINPGIPKRAGVDVTEKVNKMYCKINK